MVDLLRLREVPGVKGAVRVSPDGLLQEHSTEGTSKQVSAITAELGSTAQQAALVMDFKKFDYALLCCDDENPILVFPEDSSFIGLILDVPQALVGIDNSSQTFFSKESIAASHVLSRIRGMMGS